MSSKDQKTTADGYAYLTKRTLLSKAKAAGKKAARSAMEIMGYVLVAEDGWIVRKNADGTTERVEKIPC
ncbi:hypothetical protein [Parapedobacter tibetensis]|uniref:hypothetical protein n=1 Tax=Parapedobacter tibetensis TaxID=2972951 RepID=UPI00214DB002|nr:hypothetical protein [Parapedobacter tibetensis]